MKFKLKQPITEKLVPIYRGVIKGLLPNVEGRGQAEWWTYDKDYAMSYWEDGTDDEGALLQSFIDFDKLNVINVGLQKTIDDAYFSDVLNSKLGTKILSVDKNNVYIKYNDSVYKLRHGLDDIQSFYHSLAKKLNYDAIIIQFKLSGKTISEIALLKSGLIEYSAPEWYNKQWDK